MAVCRFVRGVSLFDGQREQLFAHDARPYLEIGSTVCFNDCRKQKLLWVIACGTAVTEFDESDPVVERLEDCFLTFPAQKVSDHKDRLPSSFRAEISERTLNYCGTSEMT